MSLVHQEIYSLLRELYPLCRSLTGPGVRQTLKRLQELVPLDVYEEPSGSQVFDWVVPEEWDISEGYIADMQGRKVVDFSENNLHVMSYSTAVDEVFSRADLENHLYSIEDLPDAIPYTTSYYQKDWKFCLSHNQRLAMQDTNYRAVIRSKHYQGALSWAELYIPGVHKDEILFSCNICHPSLASNELSGPVLATFLGRYVQGLNPQYSYRFAFVPETLGCLVFLKHRLEALRENCKAAFVLTCLGDARTWSIVHTPSANTFSDRVAMTVLSAKSPLREFSWLHRGSDERQYNFPSVGIPAVCLSRSKFGEYPEYHTSLDNLELVTQDSMGESFDMLVELVQVLEANYRYKVTSVGEPFLSRKGLYPAHSTRWSGHSMKPLMNFLNACDGRRDFVDALLHSQAPAGFILSYLPALLSSEVIAATGRSLHV